MSLYKHYSDVLRGQFPLVFVCLVVLLARGVYLTLHVQYYSVLDDLVEHAQEIVCEVLEHQWSPACQLEVYHKVDAAWFDFRALQG